MMSFTRLAPFALIVAAVTWGSSYPIVKEILDETSVHTYLIARFLLTVPMLGILFYKHIEKWVISNLWEAPNRNALITAVKYFIPGVVLAFAFISQSFGIQQTTPATAAFLTALSFCFVPLLEYMHNEMYNLRYIFLPLVLAFLGVLVFSQVERLDFTPGEFLLVMCSLFYAAQIYYTGRLTQHSHPVIPFFFQSISVSILLVITFVLVDNEFFPLMEVLFSWRLLYIVLVATILCFMLQFWGQRYVKSRYVALIFTVEPLSAFYISNYAGYDEYTVNTTVGAVFILAALLITILSSQKDTKGSENAE